MNGLEKNNNLTVDLNYILNHTEELWENLRGKRIFITGGTGFFGRWILESFVFANEKLDLGSKVTVLTRNRKNFKESVPHLAANIALDFIEGDVRNFTFPAGDFDFAIHAASETTISPENALFLFDTNLSGTRNMLDFAREKKLTSLLLISSGAVYGTQPPDITHIDEEYMGAPDPANIHSCYGEGKRAAEMLSEIYRNTFGVNTKIARCFAFTGPYLPLDSHFAIGNFIRDGLNGGPIIIKGDGTPYRSYLYAADLAIWLWTILFRGKICYPYNVGSSEEINISGLAAMVSSLMPSRPDIKILQAAEPGKKPQRYVPSVKRAADELKLRQGIGLEEAIRRTISFALLKK